MESLRALAIIHTNDAVLSMTIAETTGAVVSFLLQSVALHDGKSGSRFSRDAAIRHFGIAAVNLAVSRIILSVLIAVTDERREQSEEKLLWIESPDSALYGVQRLVNRIDIDPRMRGMALSLIANAIAFIPVFLLRRKFVFAVWQNQQTQHRVAMGILILGVLAVIADERFGVSRRIRMRDTPIALL